MTQTATMSFFKRLAGHTIVFGLSTIVRPLSQLILVRLHTNTNLVEVQDFAAWTLLQVALNVGVSFLNLGLATTFFKCYFQADNTDSQKKVITQIFSLTLTLGMVGGLLMALTSNFWTSLFIGRSDIGLNGIHISLAVLGNTITIVPLALSRAEGKWKPFLAFNLSKFFSLIILNYVLLVYFSMGLNGITLSLAITNIALSVFFTPLIFKRLSQKYWFSGWNELVKYGSPLIAIDLTYWTLASVSQFALNIWRTAQDVALFGFAFRIASITLLAVVMPFSVAFGPLLFRARKESVDPRPLYARTLGYIWTISIFTCLAVTLFAPELAKLLGKSEIYHEAIPYVGWITFSSAFYGLFFVFSSGANLKNKTWVFPIVLLLTTIAEIGLNYFLTPRFGFIGASISMLGGFIILATLTLLANQQFYPIEFPWKRVFLAGTVGIVILLTLIWIPRGDELGLRILFLIFYPVLLILTGYLEDEEWDFLVRLKDKWFPSDS